MGLLHLVVFVVGCIVLLVMLWRKPHVLKRRVSRFALFMLLLLLVGAFFNGLWSCLIWDRLYHSTDYVCDFSPFWPISQRVIDRPWGDERGRLLGVSLLQLQLVWFPFAVGTWAATILLYRRLRRRSAPNNALQPTADVPVC